MESDKSKLFNYINSLKYITDKIYIYGTSIFRIINDEERELFLKELKSNTGLDFSIVSSDEEEKYTIDGVIANIETDGNLAVMVGEAVQQK